MSDNGRRKKSSGAYQRQKNSANSGKPIVESNLDGLSTRYLDVSESDPIVDNDFRPLIPKGEYQAVCYKVNYAKSFGRDTLFLRFRVFGGRYDGTELFMACRKPVGKTKVNHKLYIQWSLAMGRVPKKGERLSKKVFLHKMFLVQVRDSQVRFKFSGKHLPKMLQYSVVDTILETVTGISEDG